MRLTTSTRPFTTRLAPAALALLAGGSLGLSACGSSGAEPETARARVNDTVPEVIDGTLGSTQFLGESDTVAQLGDSLSNVSSSFPSLEFLQTADDGTGSAIAALRRPDEVGENPSGADIAQALNDVVFTSDNYEGDGYYRLRGEDFCAADVNTGEPAPECVSTFDDLELRVHAEIAGDGVDLSLAVGPDRIEPITVELRERRLTVAVDFAASREAVIHIAEVTEAEVEDLPDVFEGVVAASIIVNGPKDVTFEGAVREAVLVEGGGFSVSTEARDPLWSMRINGTDRTLTSSVDLGRTVIAGPWQQLSSGSLATGQGEIDLKGLTSEVTLEDGADSLQIENVSLGDGTSTVKLDGTTLIGVDLNPESGRGYTLTILPQDGALPTFGFDPEFDLTLAYALQPLADAGDDVPPYALDETYRVDLDGDMPTVQPVPADASGFTGGVRVVSGDLTISSTAADADVAVASGSCLVEDALEDGEHPVLGHLASASCP